MERILYSLSFLYSYHVPSLMADYEAWTIEYYNDLAGSLMGTKNAKMGLDRIKQK